MRSWKRRKLLVPMGCSSSSLGQEGGGEGEEGKRLKEGKGRRKGGKKRREERATGKDSRYYYIRTCRGQQAEVLRDCPE